MAVLPFRGLAAKGVLKDPSPYQLDLDAWSGGMNMRFHANRVERAPVWRQAVTLPTAPVFCTSLKPSSGFDLIIPVDATGRCWTFTSNTLTEVTPSGSTRGSATQAWTSTFLGDVIYLNRPDAAPTYFGPQSTLFAPIPMEYAWTARTLRAFGNYLIALNVTKPASYTPPHLGTALTGGAFPNMVKWSDLALAGQVPGSWDETDPTTSAGENELDEMTSPIVDGMPLRGIFVIYSSEQIWAMEQNDTTEIFDWRMLFSEGGLIAPNCAVEVDGRHYCFGPTDIYVHDGVQKQSIVDKRNRDYIYRYLNTAKAQVCFARYIPRLTAVLFGMSSGSPDCTFQGTPYANLGFLYDVKADTGTFIDLPNMGPTDYATINTTGTFATVPGTFATIGGSFFDQDAGYDAHVVGVSAVGDGGGLIQANRLVAYDYLTKGTLSLPYVADANGPAVLERDGLALDQLGEDLGAYKIIRRIFPLVQTYNGVPAYIYVGSSLVPNGPITWAGPFLFDPTQQYKIDCKKGGRYLSFKLVAAVPADFEVAGFDADIVSGGER